MFFNFISNKEAEFEGITESQKQGIIVNLKRLEIYIDSSTNLDLLPEEFIEDAKLQYWVVKELYFSEYKVFLDELSRKDFLFRYLKTKKYMEMAKEQMFRKDKK